MTCARSNSSSVSIAIASHAWSSRRIATYCPAQVLRNSLPRARQGRDCCRETGAVDNDIYTRNGLILGPWKNNQVQVGVVGSYEALKPLIADYRADAAGVYFPFPHPLQEPPTGNTFMRKLVLVFDRAGLARASQRASSELAEESNERGTSPAEH